MKETTKSRLDMLGYCKIILEKFAFNKKLFKKEYYKSLRLLRPQEQPVFRSWALNRFGINMFTPDVQ